jgi:extracellular factor (EF) 3-hydroxypalmitic acid methyl ester biosynthesis protein
LFWREKWCILQRKMSNIPHSNGNGHGHDGLPAATKPARKPAPARPVDSAASTSQVSFRTAEGVASRGTLTHYTRQSATFELYGDAGALRTSEVLADFQIGVRGRAIYSGAAVVRNVIDAGSLTVCEAKLNQADWTDLAATITGAYQRGDLKAEFSTFLNGWQRSYQVLPEFKVAIADLQTILTELRVWLAGIESELQSQPAGVRAKIEGDLIDDIREPVIAAVGKLLEKFELVAQQVEPESRPAHIAYMQRLIHPFVLSAPFIHRTFVKPLGYAGDYEMVSMMVRDPHEGNSLFAKILNYIFLNTPPVEAHRNRLTYLTKMLRDETVRLRALRKGQPVRIFNLGCGPAKEIQDFLAQHSVSNDTEFLLLDFNEETLASTSQVLETRKREFNRQTRIQTRKKSVQQILKDAVKLKNSPEKFDIVYCAGLFDYLTDSVCEKLLAIFYEMTAPGGLVVATNVADTNPSQGWMDYMLDWHLIYRSAKQFGELVPKEALPDLSSVRALGTGVNIVVEIRKP